MKKEGNKYLLSLEILSLISHFLPRIALEGIFILTGVNGEVHQEVWKLLETSQLISAKTGSGTLIPVPTVWAVALHCRSEAWL